jgi:hypothetical protein
MKWFLFLMVLLVTFNSCEREIDLPLHETMPKLVVEATIENGKPPVVYLSKSVSYFSTIDINALANSFVHHADVYISNGITTHKLKEDSVEIGNGQKFYFYSNDPDDPATSFVGEFDTNYKMRVMVEGAEYLASTRIPVITKKIDSLFWVAAPVGVSEEKVVLTLTATDPPGLGDYVRYFTKRDSEDFFPGINSVFDDQVIDGTTYTWPVDRGLPRGIASGDLRYFFKGDTVTLKLANIDRATYDFWRTMEYTYATVGNPFASPTRVLGNISNGALGYFGGYAAQFKTIIIPE